MSVPNYVLERRSKRLPPQTARAPAPSTEHSQVLLAAEKVAIPILLSLQKS